MLTLQSRRWLLQMVVPFLSHPGQQFLPKEVGFLPPRVLEDEGGKIQKESDQVSINPTSKQTDFVGLYRT